MPDARIASRLEDWDRLIDHILQELKGSAGNHLPKSVQKFLCELLSAILLRSYRAYSLEKLFGQGNSGPRGAAKNAIDEDNQEMSFDAVTEFAARNGFRPIETVRGNRRKSGQPGILTGFRQQYHRICEELNMLPGPARRMRQELEQTLAYRFSQSQTVFSYPDPNGTFASTGKPANQGEQRPRKVWYHQTPLSSKEVSIEAVERVVRCNENPAILDTREYWKPRRLPEEVQSITSWEGTLSLFISFKISDKTLVIIGTGPGIGRSVACLFAAKRYSRVALIARRPESLESEKLALEKAAGGIVVKVYAVDVADRDALVGTMDKVRDDLGQPECIFYNAARVTQTTALGCSLEEMEYDFKICCTSLAAITQSELPRLLDIASSDPSARPALIVTSSKLPQKPDPALFSLSLVKAAQRTQVLGVHEVFHSKGVHVGVVNVGGYVTETHETLNPTNIANKTWEWLEQSKSKPTFEVRIL